MTVEILQGDCLEVLRGLPSESVNCCVTSPPYWGLRDYGCDGQLGSESTPEEFVTVMTAVFREVRRVLRGDGTLWLNMGDTYAGGGRGGGAPGCKQRTNVGSLVSDTPCPPGFKRKDLVGVPWRLAFALQVDGWYFRQDIIWHKPNPMPESVRDRCTKSHEYIFLLAKSERYYFNGNAIREDATSDRPDMAAKGIRTGLAYLQQGQVASNSDKPTKSIRKPAGWDTGTGSHGAIHRDGRATEVEYTETDSTTRNKRSVWTVTTKPYKAAHFATFPPDLIKPCILAGCPEGGTVLDPFLGSGTTAMVAEQNGCNCIGIELNPEYVKLAKKRIEQRSLLA